MKRFLCCLCFFSLLFCKAQSDIRLSVHQDLRMLFIGDDRGNNMFTLDILSKLEIDVFKFRNSAVVMNLGAEYADLVGGNYKRFLIGFGYIKEFQFLPKFNFGVFINHGLMLRKIGKFMSFSADFEVNYPISKKLRASIIYQLIDRTDLSITFHTRQNIKGSIFTGLKIDL